LGIERGFMLDVEETELARSAEVEVADEINREEDEGEDGGQVL
jgi:hypothetical protein